MLEVAQGVRYIHSQEIVHGDLSGVSVLMLHSRDHTISSSTRQTSSWIPTYDAKSLTLGYLDMSKLPLQDPLRHERFIIPPQSCLAYVANVRLMHARITWKKWKKPKQWRQTYMPLVVFIMLWAPPLVSKNVMMRMQIFFDTVPFKGKSQFQIMWLLSRLREASGRPTMKQINDRLACPPSLLIDLIDEVCTSKVLAVTDSNW